MMTVWRNKHSQQGLGVVITIGSTASKCKRPSGMEKAHGGDLSTGNTCRVDPGVEAGSGGVFGRSNQLPANAPLHTNI